MDDMLLLILSLIGLGALYWVLFGQRIQKKMFSEESNNISRGEKNKTFINKEGK